MDKLSTSALLAYSKSRGIPVNVARTYCHEVHYRFGTGGKVFYAIGWKNDAGGYELRNSFSKIASSPKDITTVNDLCDCTMLVLEGFFDFLSAATLHWFRPAEMNAVVLNSTALLDHALPILQQAKKVICLLDHDNSGRAATERILQSCPQAEDHAHLYSGAGDLNEYHMNNSIINKKADGYR